MIYVYVDFSGSIFASSANFQSAQFLNTAKFSFVKIDGVAIFDYTRFENEAYFGQAVFHGRAFFSNVHFERAARFSSAIFEKQTDFNSTIFCGSTNFASAKFSNNAEFRMARFDKEVSFSGAEFSGFTYFVKSKFVCKIESDEEPTISMPVNFRYCFFEKPLNFDHAVFKYCYPEFDGASLHGDTTFSAKAEFWPKTPQKDPEQARTSCAVIRHTLGKQGLPEEEHFFFRREMAFAGQIGGWWQRLPYRAFGWISDYGYSISRPLWGLVLLLVGPALIYFFYFNWPLASCCKVGGIFEALALFVEPLALSFASILKFFGFQSLHFGAEYFRDLPDWIEALTALQTVFGFVLLFFRGLGLRTRFRLR